MTIKIKGKFEDWSELDKVANRLGFFLCSYQGSIIEKFTLVKTNSCFIAIERGEKCI